MRSLRDLAEKVHTRAVPMKRLGEMADEEVIESLIPVRGIGRWTAQMFLIFSLGEPMCCRWTIWVCGPEFRPSISWPSCRIERH